MSGSYGIRFIVYFVLKYQAFALHSNEERLKEMSAVINYYALNLQR